MQEIGLKDKRDRLAADLMYAESLRNSGKFEEINRLYAWWVSQTLQYVSPIDSSSQTELKNDEYTSDLAFLMVGLLGLGRIKLVADTAAYKNNQLEGNKLEESLSKIEDLFVVLAFFTLVPWTIHGGSINWLGELAQDKINVYAALGKKEDALTIFHAAKTDLEKLLRSPDLTDALDPNPAKLIHEGSLDTPYMRRQRYLGALSALGVLYLRGGTLTNQVSDLVRALELVRQAHEQQKNPDRLRHLAKKTIVASLDPRKDGGIGVRCKGIWLGSQSMMV